MIAIIDYGVGNLFSLSSSLRMIGADAVISGDTEVIKGCERLILPGVGAFGDAMEKLKADGLDRLIIEEAQGGKPLLGICLGMQLLFEKSYEFGEHKGLGLIKGSVVPLEGRIPKDLKIPHIGWNSLKLYGSCPIFKNIKNGDFVYFVHSYFADGCGESLAATTEYGAEICAAASNGNVYGCQFHPEKSGETGLAILRAFCNA